MTDVLRQIIVAADLNALLVDAIGQHVGALAVFRAQAAGELVLGGGAIRRFGRLGGRRRLGSGGRRSLRHRGEGEAQDYSHGK